ncbi:hypothetical protein BCF59_0534 [Mycoplasmopsis mustelae]|uniref:Restriction endonuclease n=1 Tax=Mycoplasmopsis mustelae TaxID=171289 RepID=A0A4R7UEH3_9BACT|nr:restriction endonuclease [Mycoplasmopsis mustelae]TDV23543.1 hypothetical protein BCF59_0534 [Mycoplasmopsis mustelae]
MEFEKILLDIIEEKYKFLGLDKKNTNNIFWKIIEFEGNAIGNIGEKFVKEILKRLKIEFVENTDNKSIHNEYDIHIQKPKEILLEIKSARLGKKNLTFQFNGINPDYNYDYLICIGISETQAFYKIISKRDFIYIHQKENRGHWIKIDGKNKKLVEMNPDNKVNYKLTLHKSSMNDISNFAEELTKYIFK